MNFEVVEANPNEPVKVVIHGREGVGKSTLGAMADSPIFVAPEGGYSHLKDRYGKPVKALKGVSSWDSIVGAVKWLRSSKHDFKTMVLDSIDWAEKSCHQKIIGSSDKDIIRVNGGYSAGLRESEKLHKELIDAIEDLRLNRDMHIVCTAHSLVKEVKDPDMVENYDSFIIGCDERVSKLWREWANLVAFARLETHVAKKDKGNDEKVIVKGTDRRVVYTTGRPAFQAKNRYGMPHEMAFDFNFWDEILKYARNGVQAETSESVQSDISELFEKIADEKIQTKIVESISAAKGDVNQLVAIRKRMQELTMNS